MVERTLRLPLGDASPTARLLYGVDVMEGLQVLPDASVHVVCTSPPYWGLRDYGTASWSGGDPSCDHNVRRWEGVKQTQGAQSGHSSKADRLARQQCVCGAVRQDQQVGLEETPEEYVTHLVDVFQAVKRVLRSDGTLWINLGDSYCSTGPGTMGDHTHQRYLPGTPKGLKPKDLVGIPWRVAFALQAAGWYLRSDIIWSKPNPMPESVTDRPTKSHEYVFLFAHPDSGGRYFYDCDAIREGVSMVQPPRRFGRKEYEGAQAKEGYRGARDVAVRTGQGTDASAGNHFGRVFGGHTTRNKRSVWTINPRPYQGAHFATWPPELVELMIKAGSSRHGVCPACGGPWQDMGEGWVPTCQCENNKPVYATVLDPFSGSATTGYAALNLGRDYIGIDLNLEYLPMAETRVVGEAPPAREDIEIEGSVLDLFGSGA